MVFEAYQLRAVEALESIAASLEKAANPVVGYPEAGAPVSTHVTSVNPGYCLVSVRGQMVPIVCRQHVSLPPHQIIDGPEVDHRCPEKEGPDRCRFWLGHPGRHQIIDGRNAQGSH